MRETTMVTQQKHATSPWKRRGNILTYVVLTAWLIFVLFPLYWMVIMSLKDEKDVFIYPPKFFNFHATLNNYLSVLNLIPGVTIYGGIHSDFPHYFINSLILCGGAIVITVVFGTMAAYGLSRYKFFGREPLALLIVMVRMVPLMTILIPLYLIYRSWGLYNTYPGLILSYLFIGFPFYTWLIRGHISSLSRELDESAILDGCSTLQVLYYVVVPIISPGIVSSGLLVLIYMWNNFLFALLLGGTNWAPVPVGIYNYIGYSQTSYTYVAAACVICVAPVVTIGMFIQKYIVLGLASGAVKG